MTRLLLVPLLAVVLTPEFAEAAPLDGATLRWPWALPFAGILLTIALAPLAIPRIWHRHFGKFAFVWATLAVVPIAAIYDVPTAVAELTHAMLGDYLSFIVLLFALYVTAGGILVIGNLRGTPLVNTSILALGTVLASFVGTTGAAMILIRPLLRANSARLHNMHVVIFFIFLVANIGGALSPLGDPPLFVGFLHGVRFFWMAEHILAQTTLTAGLVLAIFFVLDLWYYRQDKRVTTVGEKRLPLGFRLRGVVNLVLVAAIIAAILGSALWQPGIAFDVYGTRLELQNVARDGVLLLIAFLSLLLTPNEHRESNGFTWDPILEVAILFAAIFTCIIPVLAMLHAGRNGALAPLLAVVTRADGTPDNLAYFWVTGALSALLDNAPTYLVFFELAGGDAQVLMHALAPTLAAISMGAVYMGALTYIGNAPNLMVYAIAQEHGYEMPSFFGYIVWSALVLLPVFAIVSAIFVAP